MAEQDEKRQDKKHRDAESDVWNAIAAFEQIIEAIPDDRASLEALLHAYQQIGDNSRAVEYFLRLGNVLVREDDLPAARHLAESVSPGIAADERVDDWLRQLNSLHGGAVGATAVASDAVAPKPRGRDAILAKRFNLAEELSFAWMLMEGGVITQDEYSGIVEDLTEMSGGQGAATISVLHVIESRGFKNLNKIVCYAASQCGTPIISLGSFDIQSTAALLLPRAFMAQRGVVLFDLFGKTGLAAVMNPHSQELRSDIEIVAGCKCHYYLTLPSEFDRALDRIDEMVSESGQE